MNLTLYQLLKKEKGRGLKAVEVITDNQAVFQSNVGNRTTTHFWMAEDIEKKIYAKLDDLEREERQAENAYIFLDDEGVVIHFPDDGKISTSEFQFIVNFITSVSLYNREVSFREKLPMEFDWHDRFRIYDIKEIPDQKAREWMRYVRKKKGLRGEIILGNNDFVQNENYSHRK